ncbi:MAG: hypothetical protein H6822_24995 [Planctomycetaceae bacterium]|nr:hypothetical protein [Planctomycetales bacterium]MCB9925435.1 hypothetical protein [Planctomycetaceae bacterium]
MYRTSQGERTLRGAERRLFLESLGMIVDFLSDDNDYTADITIFDELQRNQKVAVLLGISRALLRENVTPPTLTAISESAVAVVYGNIYDRIVEEIETTYADDGMVEFAESGSNSESLAPSWRELVLAACREVTKLDDLPAAESSEAEEWEFLIDCLRDLILWDRDWQMIEHLDVPPETGQRLKEELGIDDAYFVWVPPDPTNEEAAEMVMELRYLTPEGRRL